MGNYFTLFGLPAQYAVDTVILRQQYLTLQEHLHPDKSLGKMTELSPEMLNQAYAIIQDPLGRAEHLLHHLAVFIPKIPPPHVLSHNMMQREALEEATTAQRLKELAAVQLKAEEEMSKKMHQAFASGNTKVAAEMLIEWRYIRKFGTEIRQKHRIILLGQ